MCKLVFVCVCTHLVLWLQFTHLCGLETVGLVVFVLQELWGELTKIHLSYVGLIWCFSKDSVFNHNMQKKLKQTVKKDPKPPNSIYEQKDWKSASGVYLPVTVLSNHGNRESWKHTCGWTDEPKLFYRAETLECRVHVMCCSTETSRDQTQVWKRSLRKCPESRVWISYRMFYSSNLKMSTTDRASLWW